MTFLLTYWRWIVLAALLAASAAFGAYKMHQHDQVVLDALKSEYSQFKGGVEALGKAAQIRAKETEAANEQRRISADVENKRSTDKLLADIAGLRSERAKRDTAGGFVSQAAPGALNLKYACYDSAKLDDALRKLDRGVQGLVAEGDKAVTDMNSSRAWAQGR